MSDQFNKKVIKASYFSNQVTKTNFTNNNMTKRKLVSSWCLQYLLYSHQEEKIEHKNFHFIHNEVLTSC